MTDAARLRELEDKAAIQQLFVDYARYLDGADYDGYGRLFARNGVFGKAVGAEAIAAQMARYGEEIEEARRRGIFNDAVHVMSNHDIRLSGDTAKAGILWCYITTGPDGVPIVLQMGRYDDDLVREGGAWKIACHRIERLMGRAQRDVPAPSRTDELERRLQHVEDREAIQRVCTDISNCLDARDLKGYGALFTEDGEWSGIVGRAIGPAAIDQLLSQYCKPWESEGHRTYHTTVDMVIDVDGDTAKATSKWQHIIRGERDEPVILHLGHYDDRLRRTADGWRFTRRAAYGDIPYFEPKFQLVGLAAADRKNEPA